VELHPAEVPLDAFVREIVDLAAPQAEAAGIRVSVNADTDAANIRVDAGPDEAGHSERGGECHSGHAATAASCASSAPCARTRPRFASATPAWASRPELRDKIFRLYYTTKPEGSGIGLAMTFRIVQLHDGAIDFTSEPGKGTTFVLRLPVSV
jgi:signal transduction histidine kinase